MIFFDIFLLNRIYYLIAMEEWCESSLFYESSFHPQIAGCKGAQP